MSFKKPPSREPPDWNSQALEMAQQSLAEHDAADTADGAVSPTDQWHSFSHVVSEIWESMNFGVAPMDHTDGDRPLSRTLIESMAGTRLGHYEIMEVVGHGGFGIVFRARDRRLQRDVAIKIPRPEWLTRAGSLHRFIQEARLAAVLRHPGIVQVIEARQIGPVIYIASEFCKGPSLRDWLQEHQPLSPQQAAKLLADIADAVGFAHSQGVVHQDLKTANVLLDHRTGNSSDSFAPRVTDFGLSFRVEDEQSLHDRLIGGTPEYMAPEQREGHATNVGPHTDVYALGIMLQQMLGRADLEAPGPTCPRDLVAIFRRCTDVSTHERYRDGWELRDDLRRFLLGDPVRARPISARESLFRWVRRRPALATLAAALVLMVVASIIGLSSMLARERHLRQIADRRQQEAENVVDTMLTRFVHQSMLTDAKLTDEQAGLLEQALQFYENLSAELPSDDRRRHKVSDALHRLSEIHAWRGNTDQAIEIRQRGIEILKDLVARHPTENQYRYDYFYNNHALAGMFNVSDRVDEALLCQERAGQQIEALVALEPNSAIYQDALITHELAMISVWAKKGQRDRARSLAEALEQRIRQSLEADPDNVSRLRQLAGACSYQSSFAIIADHKLDALAFAKQTVEALRRVVALEPTIWAHQDHLAGILLQLADLQKQSGDDEAAELAVSEGLSIFEALDARAGPNDDRRCNIANGQMVLADIFARTGRTAEARELFRSSGQTFKELRDKEPGKEEYAMNCAHWKKLCPFKDLIQSP